MTEQMTRETAATLVDMIRSIRPAWDARATLEAIGQVRNRGDVAYVAYRCLKVALDPAAATPRAITFDDAWAEPDLHRRIVAPQPPYMNRGEFAPTNPVPSDEAKRRIAELRQVVQANRPTPADTEKEPTQ